jgi:uncharacterized protein
MKFHDLAPNWQKIALEKQKQHRRMLEKLNHQKTLKQLPDLHEQAFSKIDCLQCANCCKNYSPRFKTPDVKRIAKYLQMKENDFRDKYLHVDEDGDSVLNNKPCPFLEPNNECAIYEVRPSDCERYPYTNEDVLFKRVGLTLKNATVCPAVFNVLEKLSEMKS